MTPGLKSKLLRTMVSSSSDDLSEVPYVSTKSERGSATPIAYESWTSARLASFDATRDLAIHLARYAADLST